MTTLEAMKNRYSCRLYTEMPISATHTAALQKKIDRLNDCSGLCMCIIPDAKDAFKAITRIRGACSIVLAKGKKSDPHVKEKVGYYGEQVILEATKLGLHSCWVGGTYHPYSDVISVAETEELVCVLALGDAVDGSKEEQLHAQGLLHRRTKSVEELLSSDTTEMPDWITRAMEFVQCAPSTLNKQKARLAYTKGELRAFVPDDYYFDFVDLGIVKYHFEVAAGGKFALGNYGKFHLDEKNDNE